MLDDTRLWVNLVIRSSLAVINDALDNRQFTTCLRESRRILISGDSPYVTICRWYKLQRGVAHLKSITVPVFLARHLRADGSFTEFL